MATAITNCDAFKKIGDAVARRQYYHEYQEENVASPVFPIAELPSDTATEPPSRFTDLPVELTVRILKLLPGVDIARFQRVSKNSQKLVAESVDLQYSVERYLAGTIDGDSASLVPLPERLSTTRKWRKAWADFAHTKVQTTPDRRLLGRGIAKGPVYTKRMVDGLDLPWALVEGCSLEFGLLPSELRRCEGREWALTDLPPFHTFACDYDQDVLILVSNGATNLKATIHFLTMDTGSTHPLASGSSLELTGSFATDAHFFFDAAVLGDIVCLRMHSMGEDEYLGQLWAVNWKTGQTCMDIHGIGLCPRDFAFLDSDHILVVPLPNCPGNIFVFDCRTFPPGAITLEDALKHCELVLELPSLNEDCRCDSITIECRPIRTASLPRKNDALFSWANKLPVVRVRLFVIEDDDEGCSVDILIPASTILSRIEQRRNVKETCERTAIWGEWMTEARMVDTLGALDTHGVCGSRYITVSTVLPKKVRHDLEEWEEREEEDEDEESAPEFVIFDFDSPPAMLEDILSGEIDAEVGKRFLYEDPVPRPDSNAMFLFSNGLNTSAPCRVIRTGIPAEHYKQAELCEDGIIVGSRYDREELRIYTI